MPHTPETLFTFLKKIGVEYTLFEHPAVFTVEEAQKHCGHIPGTHCKNLFLKDKKDALWLVTAPDEKAVDLKALPEKTGCKRVSFGNADLLMQHLGVVPGSVTPLSLINDNNRQVQPILDKWMMEQELINVHPLVNTATVTITPSGLMKFMEAMGHKPLVADV
jgi:Ala-tRNA(Pro) deacylase